LLFLRNAVILNTSNILRSMVGIREERFLSVFWLKVSSLWCTLMIFVDGFCVFWLNLIDWWDRLLGFVSEDVEAKKGWVGIAW
jgi:hypothetical protein